MKKISLLIMGVIFVLVLSGCQVTKGGFSEFMSVETQTGSIWSKKYQKINGSISKYFNLEENEVMSFDIVTEKGELSISLVDSNGETIYSGSEIPTSTFEVTIPSSGRYELTVEADHHKGSFEIMWGDSK